MKKILLQIVGVIATMFLLTQGVAAAEDFNLVNKSGTIQAKSNTILVGSADKNTSIIDLFSKVQVNEAIIEDVISVLDVRYITPDKKDFKITSDTDIIDAGSEVYVLFKINDSNSAIQENASVNFSTKNLKLKEIGTISNKENNSYDIVYNVKYTDGQTEEMVVEEEPVEVIKEVKKVEEQIVDTEVMKENNTGIKDTILIILGLMFLLFIVFRLPSFSD